MTTTAGDLELRIPKLRTGTFFATLLERRRRVDRTLFAVMMEAYLHGVSTEKVDDLVKALGAVPAPLKARGLGGVQLVISDAHTGLKAAVGWVFLGTARQRCRVHFMIGALYDESVGQLGRLQNAIGVERAVGPVARLARDFAQSPVTVTTVDDGTTWWPRGIFGARSDPTLRGDLPAEHHGVVLVGQVVAVRDVRPDEVPEAAIDHHRLARIEGDQVLARDVVGMCPGA